ncbi:MAG: cupredoxin domain-containing protein [Actinomycetota bacterium]|nr:cupredoxin domain-containing protein [Actinomycetota bacterium]
MLTPTSKVFLPVGGVALFLGAVYKILSGDVLGGTLYLMVGVVAFALGVVLSSIRENELVPAIAADAPPPVVRAVAVAPVPSGGAWPLVAAVAVGLVLTGLVESSLFAAAGVLVGLVAVAGWLSRASSESTGRAVSLLPVGLPVLGLSFVASVMFFLSRVLLAVPKQASTGIALSVAILIMVIASVSALRPNVSSRTMAAALALGAVLMVGGGVAAAAVGERQIGEGEKAGAAATVQVQAQGIAFVQQDITFKADTDVQIKFQNKDSGVPHNIVIFATDPSKPVFRGDLLTGPATTTYKFHAPAAGQYKFQCEVHPTMKGTVTVS